MADPITGANLLDELIAEERRFDKLRAGVLHLARTLEVFDREYLPCNAGLIAETLRELAGPERAGVSTRADG